MTLEELIISFDRPGYTPKKLSEAILSWVKEQLPKEKELVDVYNPLDTYTNLLEYDGKIGYNQCLQDILNKLKGE
jgi:hypothetical protein